MRYWKTLFGLWSIQGFIALCWLLFIPTDTENAVALGFSGSRLALLSITLLVTGVSIYLLSQSYKPVSLPNKLNLDRHTGLWDVLFVLAFLATLAAPLFIITLDSIKGNPVYPAYASRLLPLSSWFGVSGLELALFIAWHRHKEIPNVDGGFRPLWNKAFFLFIAFVSVGVFVVFSKIGITPDRNFGDPAIPLFEWQILLILFIILLFAFLPRINLVPHDKWIAPGIYILTAIFWLSQPVHTAYTATPPRPPAYEIFPFSDPLIYAQSAQSALIGNGFFWPQVPARPFYIAFLTWLHLFGNQDYNNVIFLQTLVLSIFPAVLFLIGKEFGGYPLGLGLSLLAVSRDINANVVVSFASNVTYSKLLLSELPVALLLSLVALLTVRWMRLIDKAVWRPLLIGGMIGVATLIRTQSIILLFVIILFAFFVIFNSDRRHWLTGSVFLISGVVLTLAPWMIRNFVATGGFIIDNPLSQTVTWARRWSGYTGEEILARLPGENDAQYSDRATKVAVNAFQEKRTFIIWTAANHFINNEIDSLLVFPARDEVLSPTELIWPQHSFWTTPLSKSQLPLFVFYLFLFAIGIAAAWQRYRLIGLLPFVFSLTYNMWTSLFFSSGERFVFSLDWGMYLYQFFGLIILGSLPLLFVSGVRTNVLTWLKSLFNFDPMVHELGGPSFHRFIPSLILVISLGAFLPITEFVFPQRYPPRTQEEIIKQIGWVPESGEIALYGRAIYPRYYNADDGEPGTAKLGYERSEDARLVFFLVGPQDELVIFKLKDVPGFFPHASDVFMIGTQVDNYFAPRIVKVIKNSRSELYKNE